MGRSIIVAGIGTEIGKTVTSAILCEALEADYWKPVQAGELENSDSHKVQALISNEKTKIHPEAYSLGSPMSPHAAAEIDGLTINCDHLQIPETDNNLIIELAGGLMVPLTKNYLNIDLVSELKFPVVLVSSYYLGSINHTLLSWEALVSRNIEVIGIVFNGEKTPSTDEVILHRTQAQCLLEIKKEQEIKKETIRNYANQIRL